MWEKIKDWWENRHERRQRRKLVNALKLKIAVNQILYGGPDYADYDFHEAPVLLCSVYFQKEEDWTIVDFSREEEGLIHLILYTPQSIADYKSGIEHHDKNKKEIHTIIQDAVVHKRFYSDGSEGWCFS